MKTETLIHLQFFFREDNESHQQALQRVYQTLRTAGVEFSLDERPIEEHGSLSDVRPPALPCLRRVFPSPERLVVGRFESASEILTALGLNSPPPTTTAGPP
jgi:hypothetical protein